VDSGEIPLILKDFSAPVRSNLVVENESSAGKFHSTNELHDIEIDPPSDPNGCPSVDRRLQT
jgi:hypothetical protein